MTNSRKLPNLMREGIFKPYAQSVFVPRLGGQKDFDSFYFQLTDEEKNLFLGAAAKYVFLVRNGDWHVDVDDSNPVIDYLTNSFKLVSLFSLIESLSPEKHQDFYDWLKEGNKSTFPVKNKAALGSLYKQYKQTYGSIRRCVKFFERLPVKRQTELRLGLTIEGKPTVEIKEVAKFLYALRSKFVHEGEFVLEIANIPIVSRQKEEAVINISIPCLLHAFEEGLIAYFREGKTI